MLEETARFLLLPDDELAPFAAFHSEEAM